MSRTCRPFLAIMMRIRRSRAGDGQVRPEPDLVHQIEPSQLRSAASPPAHRSVGAEVTATTARKMPPIDPAGRSVPANKPHSARHRPT